MHGGGSARAGERSTSGAGRARPAEKSSNAVDMTRASSTKATTTSISVKPFCFLFIDRHPPGEPVDVHQVLALAGGHRDAPAGGAAVGIEADRAALRAGDLGLRGVELELDGLRNAVDLLLAAGDLLARLHVDC